MPTACAISTGVTIVTGAGLVAGFSTMTGVGSPVTHGYGPDAPNVAGVARANNPSAKTTVFVLMLVSR
jgi:hypothetical protein